jgi:putative flippase GtrA
MESDKITKEEKKKNLIAQILKFGVVGGLSFVIDFIITLIVSYICRMIGMDVATAATVGGLFGFCISLIFNYLMSMKFVFERRDDLDRKKEFAIFAFLSLIGLGINELILYFGVIICDKTVPELVAAYPSYITAGVKMVATGVVMVYNFISRKMTLEKR